MDEKLKSIIADEIMFAKEAAEFLGISVQRLNKLVHKGDLLPVKMNPSGTLFLKRDLEERKYANETIGKEILPPRNTQLLKNNNDNVQEAVNYFTIQSYCGYAYKKAEAPIEYLKDKVDFKKPLFYKMDLVAGYLGVANEDFLARYELVLRSFEKLLATDEVLSINDENYPFELKRIDSPPPYIFLRGDKKLLNKAIVAISGSKSPVFEEKDLAFKIARYLMDKGFIIASGLAKGIDSVVLNNAVNNRRPSIAVLGTPLNRAYPIENENLQKEISRDGLVISQYAPSAPGKRWQFPIRGITLSGISQFTVIVDKNYLEGDYKLIEYSLKHGRVVFMPLPAKITLNNRWLEKYINRKGIVLYRDFDDFVRQINIILS